MSKKLLWDAYKEKRSLTQQLYKDTPQLGLAVLEIWWDGYVSAAIDNGFVPEEDRGTLRSFSQEYLVVKEE